MKKPRWDNPWVRIGSIAAIELVVILGWYVLYFHPARRQVHHLREQRNLLRNKVHAAEVAAIQVQQLQARIDSVQREISAVRHRLVALQSLDEVVARLAEHARARGFSFTSVEPDYRVLVEGKFEGPVGKLPVRIQGTGQFFAVGQFLDTLGELDFLFEPTGTTLQYDPSLYPKLRVYLSGVLYLRGSEFPEAGETSGAIGQM
ncbi:MAG: type 4a pilus biogenesis protein PilO [candidate division KSB1 bacterium]|nr:type 4a pilus biogenesis protein PilO [candidate division KSB1 bacterium]